MPKARLIDVSKCTACRGCQVACKQWNDLEATETRQQGTYQNPPELNGHTWMLLQFRERPGEWLFRPQTCMHCTIASCEEACPTGAISHRDGAVVIDQEWCIGCGYCVQACPFHIPHKDEETGTARKCTFCIDRTSNGYETACAKTCPTDTIQFGERADLINAAHKRVAFLKANGHPSANLYGEHEFGGLHTLYVLTDRPSVFGLPENPQLASSAAPAQWLSGVVAAGVVAALPFWLLFKRSKQLAAEESKVKGGAK